MDNSMLSLLLLVKKSYNEPTLWIILTIILGIVLAVIIVALIVVVKKNKCAIFKELLMKRVILRMIYMTR